MNTFENFDDVIDFAVASERRAYAFYTKLSKNAENNAMKKTFEEFAAEEKNHEEKLLKIKEDKTVNIPKEKIMDLKLGDFMVNAKITDDMTYQEALILAMKREKAAYKLYTNLAFLSSDEKIKKIFTMLANEEAKHKLKFETEYDDIILGEN